jgi:hypothetical protein
VSSANGGKFRCASTQFTGSEAFAAAQVRRLSQIGARSAELSGEIARAFRDFELSRQDRPPTPQPPKCNPLKKSLKRNNPLKHP